MLSSQLQSMRSLTVGTLLVVLVVPPGPTYAVAEGVKLLATHPLCLEAVLGGGPRKDTVSALGHRVPMARA